MQRHYTIRVTLTDDDGSSDTTSAFIAPSLADARIDVTLGLSPTAGYEPETGEFDILPASEEWIDEWDEFYIEIWVSDTEASGASVARASFTLTYNTAYFTATDVQPGPAFCELSGYIDDAGGYVSFEGSTDITSVGDGRPALLARLYFQPTDADPGVPLNAEGHHVLPADDFEWSVSGSYVELVDGQNGKPTLGMMPATKCWPVMYDIDDDGQITCSDFVFFTSAFLQNVDDLDGTFVYASDFDQSGWVDFVDFAFLAANFGKSRSGAEVLVYPTGFAAD